MRTKVLITGGCGDIAIAIKDALLISGYEVFSPSKVELDVTKDESIEKFFNNNSIDILINNAGFIEPQSIKNSNVSVIRKHIDINLTGTFICCAIGLKHNPNLKIINICSAASVESHSLWSEYCATKAGVAMATKCWSEDGVDVISLSPGRTKTKMRKKLFPNEDQKTLMNANDFAKVVLKAIENGFNKGENIIVKKKNLLSLLNEVIV